jgi:hypothetical protein
VLELDPSSEIPKALVTVMQTVIFAAKSASAGSPPSVRFAGRLLSIATPVDFWAIVGEIWPDNPPLRVGQIVWKPLFRIVLRWHLRCSSVG